MVLLIVVFVAFTSTITFNDEIKASMQPLETNFESLLRTANLHEDVIDALRMEEILDREMFAALDSTEEGLAQSQPRKPSEYKEEVAKLKEVWNQAKLQEEAKQKVERRGT